MKSKIHIFLIFLFIGPLASAQSRLPFLQPADSLHAGRFWTSVSAGTALYGATSVGLYHAWYKDFELVGFHTFDDMGEWEDMDKVGHFFSAYTISNISFQGARWTGMNRRSAMWTAVGVGTLIQSTIEVMDAFSAKWGFSWADMGFNTLGVGLFATQEMLWQEQRIIMKVSSRFGGYPDIPVFSEDGGVESSLRLRALDLYGSNPAERFLKDYNSQTIWLSANISAFQQNTPTWIPRWLNVAVGYGAENMYGGFDNSWMEGEASFRLSANDYPRYRQFYLSLDIDFARLNVKSRFLRSLLYALNWIKIPAPALEITSRGGIYFHPLHY